jgi:hypothetical protein
VSPRLGDAVGSIDVSDDVKAHIRSLRTQRAPRGTPLTIRRGI